MSSLGEHRRKADMIIKGGVEQGKAEGEACKGSGLAAQVKSA